MAIKLVIFDFDGVLVDSEFITSQVTTDHLRSYGVDADLNEILKKFTGMHDDDKRVHWLEWLGSDNIEKFATDNKSKTFDEYRKSLVPFPKVLPLLQNLQVPFCTASNSKLNSLQEKLKITKLDRFFNQQNTYVGSMVAKPKPAPDLYLYAAKMQNIPIHECLVIEDSQHGVHAAVKAGMKVVGYHGASHCYDGYKEQLQQAGASLVFDDLAQIPQFIRQF